MTTTGVDAIVIGAGPAGATAAILLAQQGWRTALVEKHAFPRRKVCGECIAASNLPLLDALGIGESFARLAGAPLRRVALLHGDQVVQAPLPRYAHPAHPYGRALSRAQVDTLLLERARQAGATVLQPRKVRALGGSIGYYTCELAATAEAPALLLTAPVVICANGSWEPLPSQTLPANQAVRPMPPRASDLLAFKVNLTGGALEDGLLPVVGFAGGYGGLVRGGNGVITLACCIRRDALARCRAGFSGKAADAVMAYLMASSSALRNMLTGAHVAEPWLSVGPIRPGIRLPGTDAGGVFAIGNAAAEAHPIIGEGMSMAMQSAWLLCEKLLPRRAQLLAGAPCGSLHRDYAHAWRRHFSTRFRLAALFAHAAMRPALIGNAVPLLQRYPTLLTQGARYSGKVTRAPVTLAAMLECRPITA